MAKPRSTIEGLIHELAKGSPSRTFVRRLASACWQDQNAEVTELPLTDVSALVLKASLSEQPAALFCGHNRPRSIELLNQLALVAYHFSIEWGIITNKVDTLIFNSHWLHNGGFFRLPVESPEQPKTGTDLLKLFTPEGMLNGQFEHAVREKAKPDQYLLPVDEALVDQLDFWRGEAMRHSRWTSGIDESVQLLFSQLFILRAVEDRKLLRDLPTLQSALTASGDLDLVALERIFTSAAQQIQSDLFDIRAARDLPQFVVAGIIKELYQPRHLVALNARYYFQWIPADVLGRAYEKYLSQVLVPTRLPSRQIQMFDEPLRDVQRVSVRKAGGVFYTPEYITRYLASRALITEAKTPRGSNAAIPRFGDITCGSGSFLTSALDLVLKRLHKGDPNTNWGKRIIEQKRVVGIDVDARAVTLARLSVWLRLAEEPNALPLPRLADCIVQGDALDEKTWGNLPDSFDIVLGNPPFLAAGAFAKRDSLAKRFETAEGRFDYAFLFYEQALKHLRNGGCLGMVAPNRLFTNRDAASARNFITANANLLTVVDFGSLEVFTGISAYIGLIVGTKVANPQPPRPQVRVISVKELPSHFAGAMIAAAGTAAEDVSNEQIRAFDAKHPEGRSPWVFLAPAEIRVRDKVGEDVTPLVEIASCFQGIKTGANDIFVVQPDDASAVSSSIVRVTNRFGERFELEREILRPVVFGSDIQKYAAPAPGRFLIYTYRAGDVLLERELKDKYPLAFSYLE